jgi:hypothetical protein
MCPAANPPFCRATFFCQSICFLPTFLFLALTGDQQGGNFQVHAATEATIIIASSIVEEATL